jgi:hypothetical protein
MGLDQLLALVNQAMTPRRRFYDYRQANDYAYDCHDTVELLAHRAIHATPALIPVIERAITLVTRAILKSDDSSGAQGDLVHVLLQAHATSVRSSTPPSHSRSRRDLSPGSSNTGTAACRTSSIPTLHSPTAGIASPFRSALRRPITLSRLLHDA